MIRGIQQFGLLLIAAAIGWGQAAGSFQTTGSMLEARQGHTATLLKDGRVLIVGGGIPKPLASAEIYEPTTGTFRRTGSLNVGRSFHRAVLLDDGKVLIAGYGGPQMEIYDPATERFQVVGNTQGFYNWGSGVSRMPDGRVALIGTDLEIFDPKTLSSTWLGRINSSGGIALADGRLLAFTNDPSQGRDTVSIFEIQQGGLKETARLALQDQWGGRSLTTLANGDVLIAGGDWGYGDYVSSTALIFELRTTTLRGVKSMSNGRSAFPSVLLPDGRALVIGGYTDYLPLAESEIYDPAAQLFRYGGTDSRGGRDSHTATLLQDGRVLITGGRVSFSQQPTNNAVLYVPDARAVSAASRTEAMAPGSLVSLFGVNLASRTETASGSALPTTLAGVSVRVRDLSGTERLARLLYASPTQVNFELPAETALGAVTIRTSGAPNEATTTGQATAVAPALFTRNGDDVAAYATRLEPNGARTLLPVGEPIVLDDRPVFLSIYGTGIRGLSALGNVQVQFGGITVPAEYAGPSGDGIPGLDQVNVRIPASVRGSGLVDVTCVVDGIRSNAGRLIVR